MAQRKKLTDEEQRKLIGLLEVPFDPRQIKWRVVKTGQNGRRG